MVGSAAGRQHHAGQNALHAAGNPAVVDRRGQNDTVRLDTLVDDLVDHVIVLNAVQGAVIQTVITGHAWMDSGPGRVGNPAPEGNVTGITAHDLDHAALVGRGGCAADIVDSPPAGLTSSILLRSLSEVSVMVRKFLKWLESQKSL